MSEPKNEQDELSLSFASTEPMEQMLSCEQEKSSTPMSAENTTPPSNEKSEYGRNLRLIFIDDETREQWHRDMQPRAGYDNYGVYDPLMVGEKKTRHF